MNLLFNQDNFYKNSSGLIIPKTCLPEERLIAMDFFSGAGGFSLGLIQAGINVIAAIEWDIAAVHTYSINLGAYPLKMIFVEESDRERAEKYFQKMMTKTEDGIVHEESGASLRAVGAQKSGLVKPREWSREKRKRETQEVYNKEKIRWIL